jgi:integrase
MAEAPQPTVKADEALAVIGRCGNVRDRALLAVLWSSGMRVGEIARMRVEHLDLANGWVIVPETKVRRPRIAPLDA